ncbi:UDP-N-acetylenolpyruvoylglucosamine reductase [Rickettsiales endosymbiont of Paramecium tredecaurelia]|uniref:UDP-N-acetylmuramate dehydrogenase n=1 Tax=Candidatus Sarmatiella mevalonica TaxID=2770581 RepID=UPI0019225680|nr:UDP-N-acetylmuramate dehydrogenase [Candidatus Sarmatiella mevalonica]MBL3284652.1 UDP-N-acetylenolpyruvoylglucosamine reductase [Candidatus Sarmatiella mevalonica]
MKQNYSLSHLTWFKVGGDAKFFFRPNSITEIQNFLQTNDQPVYIIGAGSNVLIRDGGFDGVILKLGRGFTQIQCDNVNMHCIRVGAGCMNHDLAQFCLEHGVGGLEFLCGIPGSVGGGIKMNAGAYQREFKDIVLNVGVVDANGVYYQIKREQIDFEYRNSNLCDSLICVDVMVQGYSASKLQIFEEMEYIKAQRKQSQPINQKTGGSTFKNKPNYKAWELIDAAGLRGFKMGGACVSQMHANFIVNDGCATARDIEELGEYIRQTVFQKTGQMLEWEIKRIGTE